MIGIQFDKEKGKRFLDALQNGTPIPGGPWTQFDMLALAGACRFAAMSQGPPFHPGAKTATMHPEQREAIEKGWETDVNDAIEFYSHLSMLVRDDEYDQHFEPHMQAIIARQNGKRAIQPGEGCK